ncbi:MAG: DUF6174 domain-containing protein [Nocardioides sp.]
MRATVLTLAAATLFLSACGSRDTPVATDPAPTSATASPTPSPTPSPTASPTVGTYPSFAPTDYAYTLSVSCFCADMGQPIRVTVAGGRVVKAVWLGDGRGPGQRAGDPAPRYRWITIDDVIDAANDTHADRVQVTWPAGQDWPSEVQVDPSRETADEEVGYSVSDVVVS